MLMEKMVSSPQLNQECAKLLKAARKKQGLTQWQLAEKLGCQQPLVAKIERAARRLDIAEYIEVALAIGVDPSKIIKKLLAEPAAPAPRR
jgi:transcriptional regulator with XRE-family HTH domain